MEAMKILLIIAVVAIGSLADDNHYDTKYDNFDIDEILQNKRLLESYTLCFIGDGKCTSEGKDIKKWIPEGVQTSCGKCTDKQKVLVASFIRAIQVMFPQHWAVLLKQTDPEGTAAEKLEQFLKEHARTAS